ncbi:MAG: phage major tail tube protein [Bacteroidales bacterium]|nr:phage major tail tube protein [Bacteroidales bacterium]
MEALNTNFAVYEDSTMYLGIASVTMPTLAGQTVSVEGAGISGVVEAIVQGHYDSMTMTLNFPINNKSSLTLSAPRAHQIELRADQEIEDESTKELTHRCEKHVMVVFPSSHNMGDLAPASQSNGSGEYLVHYWATYWDGKKIREIDPTGYVCYVDGTDYLADERKNLGMA